MAKYWTYDELTTKIKRDTDIEAENFIQPDELLGLVNEAIDEVEAHVHTLGLEDEYFLTFQDYGTVQGEELITLPTDIYAHKIKAIAYQDGDLIYQIKRFKPQENWAEIIANAQHYTNSGDYHKYKLVNDNSDAGATPAPKLLVIPPWRKTIDVSLKPVRMWYIRNAQRMDGTTTLQMDVPEAAQFVIKHVKMNVYYKEGHPNFNIAKGELEQERERVVSTLATMIPDLDTRIPQDLTWYNEMS